MTNRYSAILPFWLLLWTSSITASPTDERWILITGTAAVLHEATVVRVEFVSSARDKDRTKAFATAIQTAAASSLRLRNTFSLPEGDVIVKSISVSPAFKRIKGEETKDIDYHEAEIRIQASFHNLNDVTMILSKIVKMGIGRIDHLTYDIDDPTEFVQEAQVAALQDARKKAAMLAKVAGYPSIELLTIQVHEQSRNLHFQPANYELPGGYLEQELAPALPFGQTKLSISATVECRFLLKP